MEIARRYTERRLRREGKETDLAQPPEASPHRRVLLLVGYSRNATMSGEVTRGGKAGFQPMNYGGSLIDHHVHPMNHLFLDPRMRCTARSTCTTRTRRVTRAGGTRALSSAFSYLPLPLAFHLPPCLHSLSLISFARGRMRCTARSTCTTRIRRVTRAGGTRASAASAGGARLARRRDTLHPITYALHPTL